MRREPIGKCVAADLTLNVPQLPKCSVEESKGEEDVFVADVSTDVDPFPTPIYLFRKLLDRRYTSVTTGSCMELL